MIDNICIHLHGLLCSVNLPYISIAIIPLHLGPADISAQFHFAMLCLCAYPQLNDSGITLYLRQFLSYHFFMHGKCLPKTEFDEALPKTE